MASFPIINRYLSYFFPFVLAAIFATLTAHPANYETTAAAQAAANARQGVRHVPERDIAIPTADVSPQEQLLIGTPHLSVFNIHPENSAEWKEWVAKVTANSIAELQPLKKTLGVTVTPMTIAGVKAFIVAPIIIPEKNKNRLLIHVHGGGYVFFPGEAGVREAVLMAGFGGFKIISVDYRMPPDFPFPAALDDAMAVWK